MPSNNNLAAGAFICIQLGCVLAKCGTGSSFPNELKMTSSMTAVAASPMKHHFRRMVAAKPSPASRTRSPSPCTTFRVSPPTAAVIHPQTRPRRRSLDNRLGRSHFIAQQAASVDNSKRGRGRQQADGRGGGGYTSGIAIVAGLIAMSTAGSDTETENSSSKSGAINSSDTTKKKVYRFKKLKNYMAITGVSWE